VKAKPKGSALYVYGIGRQDHLRKIFDGHDMPQGVEADSAVALVTEGPLAAVVSEVPLSEFGEGRFEEHLKDAAWAAERVMRHEKVAEFLAGKSPVVPLRFGVMYSTPERIREMLTGRQQRLSKILDQLKDREEWGLNICLDRRKFHDRMADLSPKLAEMLKKARSSSPGQAYLLEKKVESLRAAEGKSETKRAIDNIRSELKPESYGLKDLPLREIDTRQDPAIVGKLSFLINRKGLKKFRRAAEVLARKYAGFGFSLELTGPWPPYNFSE